MTLAFDVVGEPLSVDESSLVESGPKLAPGKEAVPAAGAVSPGTWEICLAGWLSTVDD